jgi:hypothetical protein
MSVPKNRQIVAEVGEYVAVAQRAQTPPLSGEQPGESAKPQVT